MSGTHAVVALEKLRIITFRCVREGFAGPPVSLIELEIERMEAWNMNTSE